jgi:putative endonuclease
LGVQVPPEEPFFLGEKLPFFVYVIYSIHSNKKYIGQTIDLKKRLIQHNDPDNQFSLFTKRFKGPWELIYSEVLNSRLEATTREKYLKSGSGRRFLAKILQLAVNLPAEKDSISN